MQLTSAELSADHHSAVVHSAVVHSATMQSAIAIDASSAPVDALLQLDTARTGAVLPFPFRAVQLVTDYRAAAQERSAVNAYLTSVAQERASVNAYLAAMAPRRPIRPPPPPAPRPARSNPWPALRQCESGGNYSADTGNGYYGAYQFTAGSWASLGHRGLPSQAPPAQQDQAAQELQARRGWGQWPSCARRLGLI